MSSYVTCDGKPVQMDYCIYRCQKECYLRNIYKQGKLNMIDELVEAIENTNYCLLEKCLFFKECGKDKCPIDWRAEQIIIQWLLKIKEENENA